MCLPLAALAPTFAAISIVAGLAGTAASIASQRSAGSRAQQAAEYNAEIQRQQARDAFDRAQQRVAAERVRGRAEYGRQLARLGASGTVTNTGTNLLALEQTAVFNEFDRLVIMNDAEREMHFLELGATATIYNGQVANAVATQNAVATGIRGFGNAALQIAGGFGEGGAFEGLLSDSNDGFTIAQRRSFTLGLGG
jgi:hypothetical protein